MDLGDRISPSSTSDLRNALYSVEPLNEARTLLVDFFSILLGAVIELAGHRIALRHILYEGEKLTKDGRAFLDRERPDICVFGHTHQPKREWLGGTLLFNPGSAGPKRFKLPRGLGILSLSGAEVKPRLISLPDRVESHMVV